MKRLIFQVAVGEVPEFYYSCQYSVLKYAERIGADYECLTEPQLKIVPKNSQRSENALRLGYLPIFEKEYAFSFLNQYDKIAIIDSDIFVSKKAPDVFDALGDSEFGAVVERDLPLLPQYQKKLINYSRDQYKDLADVDWKWNGLGAEFYNMGMMVFSNQITKYLNGQTPKQFIERPEFEKFVNGEGKYKWSTDQTLLNYWVKKSKMKTKNLDWKWNAIYSYIQPDSFSKNPYFVHFNLAVKMPRNGTEIPEIIERLGR